MKRQKFKLSNYHDEILITGMIAVGLGFMAWDKQLPRYYNNYSNSHGDHAAMQELKNETIESSEYYAASSDDEPTEVRFTSYFINDYSGSGSITSSGLGIDDFEVNEMGWYTYDGKVVMAAATVQCLEASSGACAKYTELPEGYSIHQIYDELTIFLNGNNYAAIVLDSCGASFWEEERQRYDIFVQDSASVYDGVGYVLKMNY